ncbi:glycosyltransferase [Schumannella soli]|uniref:4,4'-diaponeurosporenoate glycosyltransferase n=1 Tax=Schumannella soli TaxID=2590779 RepID=A0A506YAN6_9MICO|nr:glycosyltransferase [Schumannella soli]
MGTALVVIPARDEAARVERCLGSVRAAIAFASARRPGLDARLLLVADLCRDDTAELARGLGADVLEVAVGNVGFARRVGVERLLLTGDPTPRHTTWIAMTDADSVVPFGWLDAQLDLADAGADVVVGTVRPEFDELSPRQRSAWLATHTPGVANGHVHGANLGVRASTYLATGGFDPLLVGEDVELVEAARRRGARVVATADAEVLTSGRRDARAPRGYSAYLAGLENLTLVSPHLDDPDLEEAAG